MVTANSGDQGCFRPLSHQWWLRYGPPGILSSCCTISWRGADATATKLLCRDRAHSESGLSYFGNLFLNVTPCRQHAESSSAKQTPPRQNRRFSVLCSFRSQVLWQNKIQQGLVHWTATTIFAKGMWVVVWIYARLAPTAKRKWVCRQEWMSTTPLVV